MGDEDGVVAGRPSLLLSEQELLAYGSEDSGSDVSDRDDDDKIGRHKGSLHRSGPMEIFRRARAQASCGLTYWHAA